jgi:rare lipoprotein A
MPPAPTFSSRWMRTLTVALVFLLPGGSSLFLATTCLAGPAAPATQAPYIINNKRYYPIPSAKGYQEKGVASWYGKDFHGRRTSNGEIYDMYGMTAAHKTLPMNTMVMVKNLENNRKVVVRINDRGPFVRGRIIDLSYTAAKKLKLVGNGTAKVDVVALAEGRQRGKGKPPTLIYDDIGSGEFYVQIGAFTEKINAIRLQKRFTDAGHTTVIQKYHGPKDTFYRVQVYAGKNIDSAEQAEKALLSNGYVGCFIIAR